MVCVDGWGFRDAVVTCRQVGFPGGGECLGIANTPSRFDKFS